MSTLKLSLSGVNYLNIFLMLISMILAIKIPFELFLFVYAILGPLHYTTEIAWLHKKSYFTIEKKDFIIPVSLCILLSIVTLYGFMLNWEPTRSYMQVIADTAIGQIMEYIKKYNVSIIFLAFASAVCMVVFRRKIWRYCMMLLMLIPSILIAYTPADKSLYIWVAIFLPTIIHVCLFTALFILYGALKSKSTSAYLSFAVYILCLLCIFNFVFIPSDFVLSEHIQNIIARSGFMVVNYNLWNILYPADDVSFSMLNDFALNIQAFIAFSYTYHYLNWFSKTNIIQWHKVSKPWLVITIAVWLFSVALYYYDYRIGIVALYALSMLHVFLEFPLNVQSILGIGREGRKWFSK